MEEQDILMLWESQNQKLEKTIQLNQKLIRETTNLKAQSALRSLKSNKIAGIVIFFIYLGLLAGAIGVATTFAFTHKSNAANYFIVSMAAIFLINLKGITDYIRHLILIQNIDYDDNIIQIQKQLSQLQISILKHSRWMFLQLPFWTTFTLSNSWFPQNLPLYGVIIQCVVTAAFSIVAIWLFVQHKSENLNKKWMQFLLSSSGNRTILKAMSFYNEIEEFSTEQ